MGKNSKFEEIYDHDNLIYSLCDVVKMTRQLPNDRIAKRIVVIKIPHRVTEEYIAKKVGKLFRRERSIMLSVFYPSVDMKIKEGSNPRVVHCFGIYGVLEFHPDIRRVGDKMLKKNHDAKNGSLRHLVALDLRMDILLKKNCFIIFNHSL